MFDGPVGMLALFLLSQATEKTSMTSTASNRKISSNNVVGSQRKTLPEIKAGVSITYCEVFGSSRRRSIAQVMNYQSGHSGRNYWNLFQILITMPKTTTFQKKLHSWCWRCYCDACWELCFWFNSFEEHQNKVICTPITWFITLHSVPESLYSFQFRFWWIFVSQNVGLLRFQFFSWKRNGLGINPAISRIFLKLFTQKRQSKSAKNIISSMFEQNLFNLPC